MPAETVRFIDDQCNLLRRINPVHIIPDKNTGKRRLSSGAFRDRQMSVDAECLLIERGLDWNHSLRAHLTHFLVSFTAGFARQQQQTVEHVPLEDNPVHAEVRGRKSEPICTAFRMACKWVVAPSGI